MKLVIYKLEDYSINQIHNDISSFSFLEQEDKYSWFDIKGEESSIEGINYEKFNCILLDDSIEVDGFITEEIISQDKKLTYNKMTLEQENNMLKERLTFAEDAILFLLDRG